MDRYIGRMLDNRYEILEVIGSGGMAVVYKAKCHRLNRLVAVKILKDENLQDADFRRRFHAESQAVAMLGHPNIVSVFDVSMDSDEDYIVMELIEGISLKQYMAKKGVLNWKETLHFAMQIARALDHAHSKGLVHRDIKPHNVMVLKTGAVKVADFGIACMMSQSNTMTKEALGSVHYISPEQAKGGRVDNRSDLYSLGIVMYEMITGRVPFDGESPVSVAIQHINGGAVKPSDMNPAIPKALEQIILKAIATDPGDRYIDAAQMLRDMDEVRKDPTTVLRSAVVAQDSENTDTAPEEPVDAAVADRPAKKKRAPKPAEGSDRKRKGVEPNARKRGSVTSIVVIALCVLLILVAIVISVVLLGDDRQGDENTTVFVPSLVGMYYSRLPEYDEVEIVVQGSAYSDVFPEGQIMRQEPQGGEEKAFGSKVFVTVSLGEQPASNSVELINLSGHTSEYAQQWLNDQKLNLIIKLTEDYSSTVSAGCIISTDPAEGSMLTEGDRVVLTVSLGVRTDVMPSLVGTALSSAQSRMSRTSFTNIQWVPMDSEQPENTILDQSVAAGQEVPIDTTIIITYSNGNSPKGDSVTVDVVIENLPESDQSYLLSVVSADGDFLLLDYVVEAGQTVCTVQLSGVGTVECRVYVDGVFYQTITVRFSADE